jgi:hypothetical protein
VSAQELLYARTQRMVRMQEIDAPDILIRREAMLILDAAMKLGDPAEARADLTDWLESRRQNVAIDFSARRRGGDHPIDDAQDKNLIVRDCWMTVEDDSLSDAIKLYLEDTH